MRPTLCLVLASLAIQVAAECKNCVILGKEERSMFRAHSEACLAESHVEPQALEKLLRGQPVDEPALRRHVYCVLLKFKMIGKDGKLQKAAVMGKLPARIDARNISKALDSCADQHGDTPVDLAWNLFLCGHEKKAVALEYLPMSSNDNES